MAKSIGRYEIREELGRGGMAVVYRAFDPRLHRDVALKLLDQHLLANSTFATRFEREARTIARLEHNAIVPLYDFGEADGWLYLVMRYMEGGTLKKQIARGPLTARQINKVIGRIGGALDKAHGQGIIHRDLKPANILLDNEGEPYLSDFGIVKVAAGDTEYLTESGQTVGTFAYMSPEQVVATKELDGRSDIYSLGIVLYEMLTGKHPFGEAISTGAMVAAHIQKPVPDVTNDNPALPAACVAVVKKAMAKDPNDRFATGREMTAAVQAFLSKLPADPETAKQQSIEQPAVKQVKKDEPIEEAPAWQQAILPGRRQPASKQNRRTRTWIVIAASVAIIVCFCIAAALCAVMSSGSGWNF